MTDFNKKYGDALLNPVQFDDYEPTLTEQIGLLPETVGNSLVLNSIFKPSTAFGSGVVFASKQIDFLLDEEQSDRTRFLQNQLSATVRKSMLMEEQAQKAGLLTSTVYSVSDILGTFALGGAAFKGLEAASIAAGSLEGIVDYEKGLEQGLDTETSAEKAAITGITTALGGLIPLTAGLKLTPATKMIADAGNRWARLGVYGKLIAEDTALTVGANVALGIGQRGITHDILKNNGYSVMAEQYKALDTDAMLVDGALGLLFGGIAKFTELRGQKVLDILFAKDNQIKQDTSSIGIAVDVPSMNAHQRALAKAFDDISQGRAVDIESIIKDANFAVKDEAEWKSIISDAIAEYYPNESLYYTRDNIAIPGSLYNEMKATLESESKGLLKTIQRKKLNTELQELNRQANVLEKERLKLLDSKLTGKGKELSRKRQERQVKANNLRSEVEKLRRESAKMQESLAKNTRGGANFEAKADLTRLSQGIIPERFKQMVAARLKANLPEGDLQLKVNQDAIEEPVSDAEFEQYKNNASENIDTIIPEDMKIPIIDENGKEINVNAAEYMDNINKDIDNAKNYKKIYKAAADCLLRMGL